MTKKEDFYINFSGLAHDHTTHESCSSGGDLSQDQDAENHCSVIAILRRHPMYDCLVLVKKYRACLNGYSLEFPVDRFSENDDEDDEDNNEEDQQDHDHDNRVSGSEATAAAGSDSGEPRQIQKSGSSGALLSRCSRRKLVSRLIDGDDPMFQYYLEGQPTPATTTPAAAAAAVTTTSEPPSRNSSQADVGAADPAHPFSQQIDDKGQSCEFVHVPLNGLLHRLRHHTESGIAVDSRVYAFAMGLKFAERILTTNSMREIQETPI